MVPFAGKNFHGKACQTYITISCALLKDTINTILQPDAPLPHKTLQNVITEDDRYKMLEHIL